MRSQGTSDRQIVKIGDLIEVDRAALASVLAEYRVRKLSVFGSAAWGEVS